MSGVTAEELTIPIPEELRRGTKVNQWIDYPAYIDVDCKLQVDEFGFFLSWNSKTKGGQVLDLSNG